MSAQAADAPGMTSYAQNGEDVVLARALPNPDGFYIDVGAADPEVDSVTKHFYDLGWQGVNVEPAAEALATLERDRPRDINLGVALGAEAGQVVFYELPTELNGCSTMDPELAEGYRREGWAVSERTVEERTLADVCAEHAAGREIDFLKIDVEGAEREVLAGADFERFRPRVVVVEATAPGSPQPAHEGWEPLLLEARYELVLFDGLNRFYVREEDAASLGPLLEVPANYFDRFNTRAEQRQIERVEEQLRETTSARQEVARQETMFAAERRESTALRSQRDEARAALEQSQLALQQSNVAAEESKIAVQETRAVLARSQAALRDARTELAAARSALSAVLAEQRS